LVLKEQRRRVDAEAALAQVASIRQATTALQAASKELSQELKSGGMRRPEELISALVTADSVQRERDRLKQKVEELDSKLTALVELQEALAKSPPADRAELTKDRIVSALTLQSQVERMVVTADPRRNEREPNATQTPNSPDMDTIADDSSHRESPGSRPASKPQLWRAVKDAISTAVTLKQQMHETMSRDLDPEHREKQIRELVSNASEYEKHISRTSATGDTRKENADLRGQVAFLKHRLDARGGRDYPPCWADESGKVEFLFVIETRSEGITVSPAWPARREADARALPGIAEALAGPHTYRDFPAMTKAVFNWSQKQSPECRHYVQLRSYIPDAIESDRARLMIENYFYKVEARR
jgi:hypothetical protein